MSSDTRRQLTRDGIASVATLGLAGLYWLGATQIPNSSLIGSGVGADAIPLSLAAALAIFSGILLLRTVIAGARLRQDETKSAEDREESRKLRKKHLRAAGMVGIGLAFLFALEIVGYIPSVIALTFATAAYNGQPMTRRLALFAVGIALLLYALFVGVLHIPLPSGIWFDLFDG